MSELELPATQPMTVVDAVAAAEFLARLRVSASQSSRAITLLRDSD